VAVDVALLKTIGHLILILSWAAGLGRKPFCRIAVSIENDNDIDSKTVTDNSNDDDNSNQKNGIWEALSMTRRRPSHRTYRYLRPGITGAPIAQW